MDTTRTDQVASAPRGRGLTRLLLVAALASFTLPFLTVTCNSQEGVAVSGLQAATTIDLSATDSYDERELTREEPFNTFALAALAAAAIALALTFGSDRSRQSAVWAAAFGAIALVGFYAYAVYRSWANVLPEVGLAAATILLVGAAWVGVGRIPRWVMVVGPVVGVAMVGSTFAPFMTWGPYPVMYMLFYATGILATALAVGAIRAANRDPDLEAPPRPGAGRIVLAGATSLASLTVVGVGAVFLMGLMMPNETNPSVASAGAFAVVVVAIFVGTSVAAWAVGGAIAHGRRRPAPEGRAVAHLA